MSKTAPLHDFVLIGAILLISAPWGLFGLLQDAEEVDALFATILIFGYTAGLLASIAGVAYSTHEGRAIGILIISTYLSFTLLYLASTAAQDFLVLHGVAMTGILVALVSTAQGRRPHTPTVREANPETQS